ncbi:MAG: Crp/Fnr family transcriptional regulator, partial [Microcystaceae cyanobacterium]
MHSSSSLPETSRPFLTWQRLLEWAQSHYRSRIFNKDERIPTRPGLLYLVERGAIRIVSMAQMSADNTYEPSETVFLGFISAGQPFEIVTQPPLILQAYAHVEQTAV